MHHSEFEDAYEDDFDPQDEWLGTPISKLMPREPLLVDSSATVADAVMMMNVNHTGCVLVQENGRLAGIFTERDVITKVFGMDDCHSVSVAQVMTRDPESLESKDEIAFALNRMSVGGYRHIPVVDQGKPVGVLSVKDIVNYLADLHPAGIVNLPPSPDSAIFRSVDGG
jgi:CBS domain-containing protein